jgi:NADH-quinone oxidoreductase subunit F
LERPLTMNFRPDGEPMTFQEYEKVGGYRAVRKALLQMTRADVVQAVTDSNLRGRGGAGFPTGTKWCTLQSKPDAPYPRYLVVDADEMEPGTFKDRRLLEGNPHQLIEGIIIGAYATSAEKAYIFLRWEYTLAGQRLRKAIAEAYENKLLGTNILGTDFSLELHLHVSVGRYICGEGSALVNSLMGKRAVPNHKQPRQTESGLWGKPTLMNNVETLCNVPHIVERGAEWFKGLSRSKDGGTKIFGVSGRVRKPGSWELPMGTTIREIIEEHAQGMRDGFRLRALMPGGGSTEFLLEEHLDLPMDYDTIQKAGSRFGTGTIIVMDDRTCPVGLVHNLENFFARESCGWCTPCRDGLPWVTEILKAIEEGQGHIEDLAILESHTRNLWLGRTFCALAPGAMEPLKSALHVFREDFERHINEKRCPWR